MAKRALDGLRVADFSWIETGPYLTQYLVENGAEIIKIESMKRIDMVRQVMGPVEVSPFERGVNMGGMFSEMHRDKLSCTLDLTHPKGVELTKEIIKISDVIVENFPPRVMKNFGLDYDVVKEIKPDIIYLSMPGFGSTGPEMDYVSFGTIQVCLTGLAHLNGYVDGPPIRPPTSYGDPTNAMFGAFLILAALDYRRRTGKGQHLETVLWTSVSAVLGEIIMDYTMNSRSQTKMGNRDSSMAPHGCYRCLGENQWVSIAVGSDDEWKVFCHAVGHPEWLEWEMFVDSLSRWKNQSALNLLIEQWTGQLTPYMVTYILQRAGIAAAPSFTNEELIHNPHLDSRGFWFEPDHPALGKRIVPGLNWRLSETPGEIHRGGPLLGEHNDYVFGELLKMPKEEIDRLVAEEVIY